jgi:hypothetical protein
MTVRILAMFASPKGLSAIRLGEEQRVMEQCISRGTRRSQVRLQCHHASTVDDLARALLERSYEIVHLSGHGDGSGFVLENEAGETYVPPPAALALLFASHSPPIRCVILNSCYSLTQGVLTALGVPFTIASERPLDDIAAIEFTRGFYDAIGAGHDVRKAYDAGIQRCLLKSSDPSRLPKLLTQSDVRQWPRERLPIPLDDGSVVLPSDLVKEGYCSCERPMCVDADAKVYCYFPRSLSYWVITTGLYRKCYDEVIRCSRCRRKHKRGHVGRNNSCGRPYKHQRLQSD